VIAMTGCAQRNADRELQRILALLGRRIAEAPTWDARNTLQALRGDLEQLAHRNITPDVQPRRVKP